MSEIYTPTPLAGLSGTLHKQLYDWIDRRKPQEEEMLRAYRDMMRIATDDDTKDVGTSKAQKSKIFLGSTRGKIRTARAKIKDSLFGAGNLPFDVKPANDDLKQFADTMETILQLQLEDMEFKPMLGTAVDSIATYGTGFIFGPFVKSKTHTSVEPRMTPEGIPMLQEQKYPYDCPYYEHARSMDCYPDPEAEDVRDGLGIYWASRKSPDFIKSLKGCDGYSEDALNRALVEKTTAYTDQGSDRTDSARMNMYRYTKEGRIWFTRFFGKVKITEFNDWKTANQQESIPKGDDEDTIEAVIIMAGGQVVKAEPNPYKEQKRPVRRCVYENVEHEMWGVGIAKNNDPTQRIVNSAFRLFIEGKAYALLKTCSIDRSKFEPSEDFKMFPGKRFMFKSGTSPEERKEAIIWHDIVDVTEGWESVIALAEKFSDDDTAITKYTQGDDAHHLNDTATGISMIMNASSLPLKEVLSNIDEMWIEDMIECLIDWDMENLEPKTVEILLGQKHAQIWTAIKQYGKTNFMEWFATGSQTFMAKEVLMHKLQGFLQLVMSDPEQTGPLVDLRELLQQVWDAGQIGRESPIYDEDQIKQNAQNGPMQHAQQAIQEIEQKATELIKQAQDQAQQAQIDAAQAKQMEQFKRDELASKERTEMFKLVNQFSDQGHQSHLVAAQIDKLQADTLASLAKAGQTPDEDLQKEGTTAESESNGNGAQASQVDMANLIKQLTTAIQGLSAPRQGTFKRQPDGSIVGHSIPMLNS